MAGTPFKMRGFSGFGNSPMKQEEHFLEKEKTGPRVEPDIKEEFIKKEVSQYSGPPKTKPTLDKTKKRKKRRKSYPPTTPKVYTVTEPKKKKEDVTIGDVIQTVLTPRLNIKKTFKTAKRVGSRVKKWLGKKI